MSVPGYLSRKQSSAIPLDHCVVCHQDSKKLKSPVVISKNSRKVTLLLFFNNVHLQKAESNGLELPSSVEPFHQFVRLQPFYGGLQTTLGYTEISITAKEATSSITFHAAGLNIEETSIKVSKVLQRVSHSMIQLKNRPYSFKEQG